MATPAEATDTARPPDGADKLLLAFAGVYLLAHFFSYGAVNVALALGLVVLVAGPHRHRLAPPWPGGAHLAFGALLGWILVSQALSPHSYVEGAEIARRFSLKPFLGLLLGLGVVRGHPRRLGLFLALGAVGLGLFCLPIWPTYGMAGSSRMLAARSIYGKEILGPNPLGGMCAVMLLALGSAAWRGRHRLPNRWAPTLVGLVLAVSLVLTGSRSSLGLLFVGAAGLVLTRLTWRRLLGFGAAAVLALGVMVAVNPRFIPGFHQTQQLRSTGIFEVELRLSYWRRAWVVIQASPWFGCGARRYRDAAYEALEPYALELATGREVPPGTPGSLTIELNPDELHNDYVTVVAMHGFPALPLFLLCYGTLLAAFWRQARRDEGEPSWGGTAGVAIVLGIMAYQLLNGVWYNKELGPFAFFYLGGLLGHASGEAGEPQP